MRVLIIGEGPHDIGRRNEWSDREKTRIDLPGWLHAALEMLRDPERDIEIESVAKSQIVLSDGERRKNMPLPKGHGVKALAAMLRASAGRYDVVVFMTDADTKDEVTWREHYNNIKEGFLRGRTGPTPVICLPKSASESWLLADPNAWQKLGLTDTSLLPSKPEDTWGDRHDPTSHHPKHEFERAAKAAGLAGDGRDQRVRIVRHSDKQAIAVSCPLSFASFWCDCAAAGFAFPAPFPDKAV